MDPQLATRRLLVQGRLPHARGLPAQQLLSSGPPGAEPDINYLAKDYDGFLQVMLDRLAVLVPGWTETHAADLGMAIVETLAYAADHLSYQQDAVGTEAYIGTARSRISLRRHAKPGRLPDQRGLQRPHAGSADTTEPTVSRSPPATLVLRGVPGPACAARAGDPDGPAAGRARHSRCFAAMEDSDALPGPQQISFYTWSDADCCLPQGATQATLLGRCRRCRSATC